MDIIINIIINADSHPYVGGWYIITEESLTSNNPAVGGPLKQFLAEPEFLFPTWITNYNDYTRSWTNNILKKTSLTTYDHSKGGHDHS